ncbi:MAG: PQQ-binding-like beta-propeller repeat protein [Gemmataceae bacterium]|nr:PQQ-binding-like beta-propeller repeat protein [Gemmataceae bacterium]
MKRLLLLVPFLLAAAPPAAPLRFRIDWRADRLERVDADGRARWSARLAEKPGNGHRPPELLWDDQRVYAAVGEGLAAFDTATGKEAWRSKGPQCRLFLDGPRLLAAECAWDAEQRWLVARAAATGKEAWRVALPAKGFDPLPIRRVAGLLLVQSTDSPGNKGSALLIDGGGTVRHRLGREVVDGQRLGADVVLLTGRDMVRLAPDGRTRWRVPFKEAEWPAGGGLVRLEGGHLVAFVHGTISDSGVQVARIDPATGKAIWQARCAPLGVDHSKYRHKAALSVEGGRARIVSKGSAGTFTELLDLRTGKRLLRFTGER